MNRNAVFRSAFWAGLASPVAIYASPVSYSTYIGSYSVPLSFAQVGLALSHSYAQVVDDGQSLAAGTEQPAS
jgi:hypothetical protein